ncbi:MAG: aminoglycoside phosphotransferase family protein [Firmicutes bacterium]|nr:aminoglycoside phosphotransferase family protein [Bacillota bacterium]
MKSLTKYQISKNDIDKILEASELGEIVAYKPLTKGEFNSVFLVEVLSENSNIKKFVLKIAPSPETPVLSFEKNMLRHEVNVYDWMKDITAFKIPKIYFKDFSKEIINADYFIYEYLPDTSLQDTKLDNTAKLEIRKLQAKFLAELHSTDTNNLTAGYPRVLEATNCYTATKALIKQLIVDAKIKKVKLKGISKLLYYVEKYKEVLEIVTKTLINFDLWDNNVIYQKNNNDNSFTLGLIDPERSFIGDPIADFIAIDPLKPLDKKQYLIDEYNKYTQNPFIITPEIKTRYYIMVGYLSLIMQTELPYRYKKTQMKHHTHKLVAKLFIKHALRNLKNNKNEQHD